MKPKGKNDKNQQFLTLYNNESDAIFRFCLIRTSDRERALDLTQETFFRFWDVLSRENQPEIENHRAFLFKISRNLIIDWYRKKKTTSLDSILENDETAGEKILLDSEMTDLNLSSEGRYVLDKIKELDPIYQQVVYMRFVEDMRPKEIAEVLSESVNVISVRITRGIQQLREITGYEKDFEK